MPGLADCLKNNGERNIRIIGVDMEIDRTVLQMVDKLYQVPRATDPSYVDTLLDICKKEKVDAHPVLSIHKKRCNCIRAELSKGTITRQFATAAKEIADELKTLAIHGDNYTAEQFKKDMTREALYALTDKRLKERQ